MKSELIKYKHYFILLLALIVANYVVVPLNEWQTLQQQTLYLLKKQHNKTQVLLNSADTFAKNTTQVEQQLAQFSLHIFKAKDEASFKLLAQSKIEQALTQAECEIERIGFTGNTQVNFNVQKWQLEIRYKGDALCLTQTTRALELMTPMVKIESYNINHRGLTSQVVGNFNSQLNVSVWYMEESQ